MKRHWALNNTIEDMVCLLFTFQHPTINFFLPHDPLSCFSSGLAHTATIQHTQVAYEQKIL